MEPVFFTPHALNMLFRHMKNMVFLKEHYLQYGEYSDVIHLTKEGMIRFHRGVRNDLNTEYRHYNGSGNLVTWKNIYIIRK